MSNEVISQLTCTIAYKLMPRAYCKDRVTSAVAFTIGRLFFYQKSNCVGVCKQR